jgi:signal transduction histidine kinase
VQLDSNQIGVDDDLIPGKYIKLTVEDTGHGIPAEVRDNVFNPFFTTKKRGGAPEWGSPSPTEL